MKKFNEQIKKQWKLSTVELMRHKNKYQKWKTLQEKMSGEKYERETE